MSHNINTYIGRQAAWHKLGVVTGHYLTWAEIVAQKGMDFEVVKDALYDKNGQVIDTWGIFRTDTYTFLGEVGKDYTCIQHSQGFEMVDALIQSVDGAHYETAGVLGKGETVWGLADLKLAIHVGDDVQNGYLLFSTSHDGTMSHTYRTCLTRVVCQNTLSAALGERSKSVFKVKHNRQSVSRLQDAHAALNTIQADVQSMEQKLNFLASRKVTREHAADIFDRLFPKRIAGNGEPVNATRRDNMIADVLAIYEANDGDAFPEQRGTAYNLLNAITNFTDHARSTRDSGNGLGRSESAMFGTGDKLKTQALQVITESANGMPMMKQYSVIGGGGTLNPVTGSETPMLDAVLASV